MNDLPEIKDKNINYFVCPTLWQEVIFRNLGLVPTKKLASVLKTSQEVITHNATLLGLDKIEYNTSWKTMGYITIIRANWHILPYNQIAEMLDISLSTLSALLREEDFLDVKLGNFKPRVDSAFYSPLSEADLNATKLIGDVVAKNYLKPQQQYFDFASSLKSESYNNDVKIINSTNFELVETYINFVKTYYDLFELNSKQILLSAAKTEMTSESYELEVLDGSINIYAISAVGLLRGMQEIAENPTIKPGKYSRNAKIEQRIIHSYLGGCGDILTLERNDYFSDELLTSLAKAKVNGIWITAIFYQLNPFPFDTSLSDGYEKRIEILKNLQKKLDNYAIKLYLYVNEPRSLPLSFFDSRPDLLGAKYNGYGALCTSNQKVKNYITNSIEYICNKIPNLGGFISITMSENLTNCYSRSIDNTTSCTHCKLRDRGEVTSEVNNLIYAGIVKAKATAKLIAWNWGYTTGYGFSEQQTFDAFNNLNSGIDFMTISEDLMEIEKMGVKTYVQDYSISNIGPSTRAKKMIQKATEQGRHTVVKVQLSNSWEMCITPYLPVFETNFKHLHNLADLGVSGLMLSWTHGGYPSPNLSIAKLFYYDTPRELKNFYFEQYKSSAKLVENIVKTYSGAFSQYPFSLELIYTGTQHSGATNPFYAVKTDMKATMVGFAYDDLSLWRGNYSNEAFIKMLENMLKKMESADAFIKKLDCQNKLENELKIYCKIFYCTFKSLYNISQFIIARDDDDQQKMLHYVVAEQENVNEFYSSYIKSNLIGYEASNHYLFTQNNVLQKIVNLQQLETQLKARI